MEKLKIYLDTSVISYLDQQDSPERMYMTRILWQLFEEDQFELFLSFETLRELQQCSEDKQEILFDYLDKVNYSIIDLDKDITKLAKEIISRGILPPKSKSDSNHLAAALIHNCDVILSWNFKHLVNYRAKKGVRKLSDLFGYDEIEIMSPFEILESEKS